MILKIINPKAYFECRLCSLKIISLFFLESFYDKEKFATFDADDTEASTFFPTGKEMREKKYEPKQEVWQSYLPSPESFMIIKGSLGLVCHFLGPNITCLSKKLHLHNQR